MSQPSRWTAAADHLGPGGLALVPILATGWVMGALLGLPFAPWHHAVCLAPAAITAAAFEAWYRRLRRDPQPPPADWVVVAAILSVSASGGVIALLALARLRGG